MDSVKSYRKLAYFIVALGALFYCYEYFLRIMPSVMKPELSSTFNIDATLFGTLSAFYFYAYTPMQTIVGIMVDRYKIRNVLCFAVLCCVLGTYLMAETSNYEMAAFGRFLQGLGSAFAFVGALKLTAMWLPAEKFAFYSGFTNMLGFLGAAFGDYFLANIITPENWRLVLYVFAIIGLVLIAIFWLSLRCAPAQQFSESSHKLSFKEAALYLKEIACNPYAWLAGILAYLIYLPTDVFAGLWGIPYLEVLHGYDKSQAGLASSMIFLGWGLGAPIQGWISDFFANRLKVIACGALFAAILASVTLYDSHLSFPVLCLLFVLFGICSSVEIITFAMARDVASPQTAGMAIAFVNTLCMMGGLIFQREVGSLLDKSWSGDMLNGVPNYTVQDYQHALFVIPVSLFLAFILAIVTRENKRITAKRY